MLFWIFRFAFLVLVAVADGRLQFSFKMVNLNGKYTFVSQENFDAYLKAADVGFITRKALTATKPDINVEVDGDHYVITTIATLKTIKADFKLGQTFKLDPGTGREATYLPSVEGSNKIVFVEVDDPQAVADYTFNEDGTMTQTMTTKGVTAKRHFKRID